MGDQRLVRRTNRFHIDSHQTRVLADQVMGQRHVQHRLPRCGIILPMVLLSTLRSLNDRCLSAVAAFTVATDVGMRMILT